MRGEDTRSKGRRALLLLAPAAIAARLLPAQSQIPGQSRDEPFPDDGRLPNGKRQQDEILKIDYEKNLKEARGLIDMAKSFEENLEKEDPFVFSLGSLKKLDNMESAIHRIRSRMKKL